MVFSISNFRGKQLCGKQLKIYLQRKPVFTIGNLLKKLKYLVFITNSSTSVKSVEKLNKLMLSKMKQHTTPEQTAKLIELGFEKPKASHRYWRENELIINNNYSIGELIEMLPNVVESDDDEYATLQMYFDLFNWVIEYTGVEKTE